jgi:hypothetical protein
VTLAMGVMGFMLPMLLRVEDGRSQLNLAAAD